MSNEKKWNEGYMAGSNQSTFNERSSVQTYEVLKTS